MIELLELNDFTMGFAWGAASVLALLAVMVVIHDCVMLACELIGSFIAWRRAPAWHRK